MSNDLEVAARRVAKAAGDLREAERSVIYWAERVKQRREQLREAAADLGIEADEAAARIAGLDRLIDEAAERIASEEPTEPDPVPGESYCLQDADDGDWWYLHPNGRDWSWISGRSGGHYRAEWVVPKDFEEAVEYIIAENGVME